MKIDSEFNKILENVQNGKPLTQSECAILLSFKEASTEASYLRTLADSISREKFKNSAILLGQIGVEIAPCPGLCKFCSFGKNHTEFEASEMSDLELAAAANSFTNSNELYGLFLMAMHDFNFQKMLKRIELVRKEIPSTTEIVVNIGDFDRVQAHELKATGVNGAYHVSRLREGTDTALDPFQRRDTIANIRESGMDWYNCCEPIGPEHTPEEIAEQIFFGLEMGCFQHAAMRRIHMPHSPLSHHGQITELRLAQIVAAVTVSVAQSKEIKSIAVHEPNVLGLTSGANTIYAETGANPRDTIKETSENRGRDIHDCKRMLAEAGFSSINTSANTHDDLSLFNLL